MPSITDILTRNVEDLESIASEFEQRLQVVLDRAAKDVREDLKRRLTVGRDGRVEMTDANREVVESVDELLQRRMVSNGYNEALQQYVDSFDGQFVAFERVLKHLDQDLIWPLPRPDFASGPDRSELEATKVIQRTLLEETIQSAVIAAKRSALQSIGAVTPEELSSLLGAQLKKTTSQAESVASTGISTFYRSVSDRGFRIIEEDLPDFEIRYTYDGPLDNINRPFCRKLQGQANAGKSWTRKQIDRMKNGQIPNVWLTAGGWRCRHQWVIDTRDLRQQQERKPRPSSKRQSSSDSVQREVKARRIIARDKIRRASRKEADVKKSREKAKGKVKDGRKRSSA